MVKAEAQLESKAVPLTQLMRGQSGRIHCTQAHPDDCSMLRAMGLRPDASVQMCRLGEPCIISLSGACRIGLAKDIASRVMVHIDE
ncbi:MAG: FeoA domain-containing protein [Phycisphaerales bacterium]|nr:FeoA domain-containing protein [Phycisphaerales bacterium]